MSSFVRISRGVFSLHDAADHANVGCAASTGNCPTDCGFVVTGREALCVPCFRLAYPCPLKNMRVVFGLSDSFLSETVNYVIHFLNDTWGYLLNLDVEGLVARLEKFAEAVYESGCPGTNIWRFIDGTVRGVARYVRSG